MFKIKKENKESYKMKKLLDDKIWEHYTSCKPIPSCISAYLFSICSKLAKEKSITLTEYIEYTHKINDLSE